MGLTSSQQDLQAIADVSQLKSGDEKFKLPQTAYNFRNEKEKDITAV